MAGSSEGATPVTDLPAGVVQLVGVFAGPVRRHVDEQGRDWTSGLVNEPVQGRVAVGRTGLAGDEQADLTVHGGPDKAVLCFAASNYDHLGAELDRPDIGPPAFGENLLFAGVDEHGVCIGDHWRIGSVLAEVSQPRRPCWKPARYWQRKDLVVRIERSGRVGWYLRILQTGAVWTGGPVALLGRPYPDWTVMAAHVAMRDRRSDPGPAARLRACAPLADSWKATLDRALSGTEPSTPDARTVAP